MNVKAEMRGGRRWITLPKPVWHGSVQVGVGINLHGLFRGARTGRMLAETYSSWTEQNGAVVGTEYAEITVSDWLHYCDLVGIDPGVEAEDL